MLYDIRNTQKRPSNQMLGAAVEGEEDVGSTFVLSLPLLGGGIWEKNRVKFKDGHNKRRKRVDEGFWGGGGNEEEASERREQSE